MHRVYLLLLIFTISSGLCCSRNQHRIVNIIVYDDFRGSIKTYDSLVQNLKKSEFIDSIKNFGKPILVPAIKLNIDTLRAERYGIKFKEVDSLIKTLQFTNFDFDKLINLQVSGFDGVKIPIKTFTEVILEQEYYKPEIFAPDTFCYRFKNECVVKVELFCRKKNINKLIKFIQQKMEEYTADFISETLRYEILKNKLTSEPKQ